MNTEMETKTIWDIANRYLNIPTLEIRHTDQLDFHDCSVWSIREALLAAFRAGQSVANDKT